MINPGLLPGAVGTQGLTKHLRRQSPRHGGSLGAVGKGVGLPAKATRAGRTLPRLPWARDAHVSSGQASPRSGCLPRRPRSRQWRGAGPSLNRNQAGAKCGGPLKSRGQRVTLGPCRGVGSFHNQHQGSGQRPRGRTRQILCVSPSSREQAAREARQGIQSQGGERERGPRCGNAPWRGERAAL